MTLFHVGYPKTATTTLQRDVFDHVRGLQYLPKEEPFFGALFQHVIWADDPDYFEAAVRAALDEVQTRTGLPLLISQEGFIGAEGADSFRTAARLHRLRSGAQVLIVVRRQRDMLRSVYGHYVNLGGYRPLRDIVEGQVAEFAFSADRLAYDELIARYLELFGAERLRVVPYEELRADFDETVAAIAKWAGGDYEAHERREVHNPSLSPLRLDVLRGWNHWFRQSRMNPSPRLRSLPFPMQRTLQSQQARRDRHGTRSKARPEDERFLESIEDRYRASNRRVEQLTGVGLGAYGYVT